MSKVISVSFSGHELIRYDEFTHSIFHPDGLEEQIRALGVVEEDKICKMFYELNGFIDNDVLQLFVNYLEEEED
jgi:hypothetical protein